MDMLSESLPMYGSVIGMQLGCQLQCHPSPRRIPKAPHVIQYVLVETTFPRQTTSTPGHPSHVTAVTLGRSYAHRELGDVRGVIEAGVCQEPTSPLFVEYVYAMLLPEVQQAKTKLRLLIAAMHGSFWLFPPSEKDVAYWSGQTLLSTEYLRTIL